MMRLSICDCRGKWCRGRAVLEGVNEISPVFLSPPLHWGGGIIGAGDAYRHLLSGCESRYSPSNERHACLGANLFARFEWRLLMLLTVCGFNENRRRGGRTFVTGVNEIIYACAVKLFNILKLKT